MSELETLQAIVADEARSAEEREAAAKHILALQGAQPTAPAASAQVVADDRFTQTQRRLADRLSLLVRHRNKSNYDLLKAGLSPDKLVTVQISLLMLEVDGNDGILYAAQGWHSGSDQSLADRMGNHKVNSECNPRFRLSIQPEEKQKEYIKREFGALGIPFSEPTPEPPLGKLCDVTSEQFAEFAVRFHRKRLNWELKEFIYQNLKTPAREFFAGFNALQRKFDEQEETIYCDAYSGHLRATDPKLGEDEAQDFLDMLRFFAAMQDREKERVAARIAARTPQTDAPVNDATTQAKPQSTFSTDDYFAYQQWKIGRDGKPCDIATWIKETGWHK